jgi:squalene-hopene/tetraprenyl-beta-curcumene cyclase
MAMDRASGFRGDKDKQAIARGVEWTVGLQSKDGGFAAFDADNDKLYLNNLPFADHGALLDPPTADVSARVVSMLAQMGEPIDSPRMKAALGWLEKEQEKEGSWFGRWVSTMSMEHGLCFALGRVGIGRDHPMVARAVAWLKTVQNEDGGWGKAAIPMRWTAKGMKHSNQRQPDRTGRVWA